MTSVCPICGKPIAGALVECTCGALYRIEDGKPVQVWSVDALPAAMAQGVAARVAAEIAPYVRVAQPTRLFDGIVTPRTRAAEEAVA